MTPENLTPEDRNPEQSTPAAQVTDAPSAHAGPLWFQRLSSVLFIVFCFELGLFLIVYPWTDAWTENYLSLLAPGRYEATWRMLWNNSYIRGAISGVGLANIWIALAEVFRMFSSRFTNPA